MNWVTLFLVSLNEGVTVAYVCEYLIALLETCSVNFPDPDNLSSFTVTIQPGKLLCDL